MTQAEEAAPTPTVRPEQAALGAIIVASADGSLDALREVASFLEPSDFWLPQHQVIYAGMLRLLSRATPPDILLLSQELNGDMAAAGDIGYIASLPTLTPSSINLIHYAEEVYEASRRRLLMKAGAQLVSGSEDTDAAIAHVEATLIEARNKRRSVQMEDKAAWWQRLQDRLLGEPQAGGLGLMTGLVTLDALLKGMQAGDLITIGALTSVGKTSMSLTIAHHVALRLCQRVLFFSLEQLRDPIGEKLLSIESGLPWERITGYGMNELEQQDVARAAAACSAAPIDVIDATGYPIEQIWHQAKEEHEKEPVALVVVDYVQRVDSEAKRDNREQVVAAVVRGLKDMALALKCPVIAPSQLNRESEMRESASIEIDADTVIRLSKEIEERPYDRRPAVETRIAEVRKNRMKPTGVVKLGFRGPQMQFVDLSPEKELPF